MNAMKTLISGLLILGLGFFPNAQASVSTPTTSQVGANMATLNLQNTGTGTGYFTVLSGSGTACGSGAQVKAGQTSSGDTAPYHGSLPLTADTVGNYTVRNLTQSAAYTICFTAESPTGSNLQDTPATANFSTLAATGGSAWGKVGSTGFSAGKADYTSLAFAPDGTPIMAYRDWGNGSKTTVMKFDGTSWVALGTPGFSAGAVYYTSLAFAPDGTPYVAYEDGGNHVKATVMRFDGTSWVNVGNPGFSAGQAQYLSLAFAPDGSPTLAYQDGFNSNKATVMKFDGTNWVNVGSPGFSAGTAYYTSLAFAPDGSLTVAYEDASTSDNKVTVMKFTGTSWANVGSARFSAGEALYVSLAVAQDGTPMVAYRDYGNSSKATVMKFNGSDWVNVGSPGFSAGNMGYTSLAFAPDGSPTVAYQDGGHISKATVMKFDGTNWVNVGSAGFSAAGQVYYTSLAFAPDGSPYVAYSDSGNSYKAMVMKLYKFASVVSAWPTASAITYGQTLASSTLSGGTVTPSGSFAFTAPSTAPNAGTASQSATFTPDDTTDYTTVTGTVSVTVAKANQTITFGAAPVIVKRGVGTVTATGGGSASAVTFTSQTTGICTNNGSTVTGGDVGTCTIAANQLGDANYNAASQATSSFAIAPNPCGDGLSLTPNQWQMLSAPCNAYSPATVGDTFGSGSTGNLDVNNYNTGSKAWVLYTRNAAAAGSGGTYNLSALTDTVAPGTGYWIKSNLAPDGGNLIIAGTATIADTGLNGCTSTNGCIAIPVATVAGQNRYNLVGNPFPYNVAWAGVRVLVDDKTVYTPTAAQNAGIMSNTIWIWNGTSYDTYSDNVLTNGNLQYSTAFWVNVLPGAVGHSVKLLIPAVAAPLSLLYMQPADLGLKTEPVLVATPWYLRLLDWVIPTAAADTATQPGEWHVRLNVDNPKTGWKDHNTVLGQLLTAKDGYDTADLVEMAPFASPYLTLVFPHPEWTGGKAGNYASDLRSASGLPMVWNVDLQADPVGSQVVLTWQGDPAILARSQLTDTLTGKVINPADPQWAKGYPVTLTTSVRHLTWSYLGR